jgi:hypothetical protein
MFLETEAFEAKYYTSGLASPRYQVPAIPTRVEYIFIGCLTDGIFVRVYDYIVCGAYADGLPVEGYPSIPYGYDYPELD